MRYQQAVRSTLFISLITAIASFLGFAQQSLMASVFGAGREVDAFVASQTIPDIFTKILQGGILSIVFVPIFVKLIYRRQIKKAWQITANLINIICLIFLVVIILGIILTPYLVKLVVPGFEASGQDLTIKLTRLLFPTVLFNLLTVLGISTLHAFRKFNLSALIKLILPITIIPLLLIFKNSLGIELLAWGNLIVSILQVILIGQAMVGLGFKFKLKLNLKDPILIKMLALVSPFIFATVFS